MIWFLSYVASIVAANLAITYIGIVPVGFGLLAPAGVYFAGLSFWLRDQVQDELGKGQAFMAIGVGATASVAVSSTDVALASGAAFLISELLDMAVYTPLSPDANWPKLMRWLDRVNGLEANPVYVEARERHESATRMRVALVAAPDSDYEQISLEAVS